MLRDEVMVSRYIGNHRIRCDRLGNDPPLLLVAPPSAADDARDFRPAPDNLRVVTDVDHNVHTIRDPKRIASMHARSAIGYVRSEHRLRLATGHTDMRKGFASLSLQVQDLLRRDPLCGHLFCFRGRRGNLMKVIWHDGQGACLFMKRLEHGRFLWPSPADGVVTISSAQLGYLLSGIDWRHPQETWRPTSVG
jgi:transposase